MQAAQGQVWELSLPAGASPDPAWRVSSHVPEDGQQRLRVVGLSPAESAQAVKPTLEEAYLLLMSDKVKDEKFEPGA